MFLVLLPGRASAEARALSLREAVSLAVRQNPGLAGAGAAVSAAEASVLAARGLDDPVLTVDTAVERTRRERVAGVPVQQRAVDGVAAAASLSQPLPIGGRVGLGLSGGYQRTDFETEAAGTLRERSRSEQYTPALQLSLEQPLLRGFGVDVARAERRRARLERSVARAEREGLAASLVRDVVVAYWTLAHAGRELAIRRASVTAAREQLDRTQAGIAVGKLSPSASAEIEVALALRQDAALLAAQAVTQRSLALGQLCGASPSEPLTVIDGWPALDEHRPPPRQLQATLARALEESPQLAALRAQVRASAVELEVTDNGLLPQLDLSVRGGPISSAPSPRAAYDQLTGFGSYSVGASLSLALPFGANAARGARDRARAGMRRAELGEAEIRAQITTAVVESIARLETARGRALLLGASLKAAALDLGAEQARFDVGRGSNFDVLRRQDALAAVQLLLLSAELAAQQASQSLDAATGKILARYGVAMREGDR
jgi:outer membrane protein TolC